MRNRSNPATFFRPFKIHTGSSSIIHFKTTKTKRSETKQHKGVLSALSQTPEPRCLGTAPKQGMPDMRLSGVSLTSCRSHPAAQRGSNGPVQIRAGPTGSASTCCTLRKVTRFIKVLSNSVTSLSSAPSKYVRRVKLYH